MRGSWCSSPSHHPRSHNDCPDRPYGRPAARADTRQTTTGADGIFRFLDLPAGDYGISLSRDGLETRNWTSYNFQVLRDDSFFLGRDGTVTGNRVAPVRSACAVLVSSQSQSRSWLYYMQQTVSAEGFSGQAFSTFVPHTVRATETKQSTDCHVSAGGDNNAWMANLLLQGTNFMNFMGRNVWVAAGEDGFEGIAVAEREEPPAIIGSHLHKLAYPEDQILPAS